MTVLRISQSINSQSVVPATSPTSPEMQVLKMEMTRSSLQTQCIKLQKGAWDLEVPPVTRPLPPPHNILHLTVYWLKSDFRLLQ